jgi:transposase
MGSTHRAYTPEYKQTAVEYVLHDGRRIVDVARNIGIAPTTLSKWVNKARNEPDHNDQPLDINERDELKQLRAENRELRMQVEFAKKVAAWFAKDPQ